MVTPAIKDKVLVTSATYTAGMAGKEPTLAKGTTAQYYRGDKTWAAMPTALSQFSNDSGFITSAASIAGNAATATKLATARKINGVNFDGTADITITAAASPQFNTTIVANSPNNLKIQLSDGGAARGWISADAGYPFRVINASNTAYVASVDNNGYLTTASGITAGGMFTSLINEAASFNASSSGMPATTYNMILAGGNDTGNKLVIFVNGSQRTADNLQNDVTIRNDGGRLVLGNANDTIFPGPVRLAGRIYANDWFRSNGNSGWYNETYGGGIFMQDNTYVRVYNNKQFLVQNRLRIEDGGTSSNFIEMWDSSWGTRFIHHNDGNAGFLNSGGGWSFMNDNGGTGYFPGNVVAYWSDRRLKKNIDNVEKSRDVGSIIDGFRVVQYDWDEEALQRNGIGIEAKTAQIGLIAQEAKANFADAVEINKSAKPTKMEEENGVERSGEITEEDPLLTINWDAITPLLLKEVQELRKRMTAVEEENASLRNRVSELEMKGV